MDQITHTPGPWSQHRWSIIGPDGISIANLGNNKARPVDECQANADLIIAAPELYAALRQVFDTPAAPAEGGRKYSVAIDYELHYQITAALMKAEGRVNE